MKTLLQYLLIIFISTIPVLSYAQEQDLLKLLEDNKQKKEYVDYAFKSSRVIMSQSMELIKPGVLDFRILHRFGNVNNGLYELFGLDRATIRMSFDFGLTKNLMVGIGRSTNKKEFDAFGKYRFIHQSKGAGSLPFSLLGVSGITLNSLRDPSLNLFNSRLAFYGQLIIGSKLSEAFSFQLSPTILHRNLVATFQDPTDMYAVGTGARVKVSKRISLNLDYFYRLNPNEADGTKNPLSFGADIETGGHVFQLHFTNAIGMNERAFLSETTNDWTKGDIQFGFNLSRSFQIKKKKI